EHEAVFAGLAVRGWRGISVSDLAKTMGLRGELGEWYALRTLIGAAKYMRLLGLTLRFNPVTGTWIVTYRSRETAGGAGLPRRLKATLAAVVEAQGGRGSALLEDIQRLRGKSRRSTLDDLRELEEMGLVERVGKKEFRMAKVLAPFLEEGTQHGL
ncbi:MAG: hypothetical protein QW566_04455, partial [Candidatus Jordarchaeales archaeon]